jgi:threonine/homoserine/homoserine lactone efflux protein
MEDLLRLLAILAALCVGVVSPGPSFIMVARTAASSSRRAGLAAALGMGIGGVVFAVMALLGLRAALLAVPSLYILLKVAGGGYLCWLGFRIWTSAHQSLAVQPVASHRISCDHSFFAAGFATQVSNPKTAVVYAGVFATFLPAQAQSLAFDLALPAAVFAIETSWYALVALLLSAQAPRTAYLRSKFWIDRLAGAVMAGLGLKLLLSARDL